jgi:hypothetical protein
LKGNRGFPILLLSTRTWPVISKKSIWVSPNSIAVGDLLLKKYFIQNPGANLK